MKFASFDLEIAKQLPDGERDWHKHAPLGITCAAVALEDQAVPIVWQGVPQMEIGQVQEMVARLLLLVKEGYTLLTWNGCAFDFRVLADETGMVASCAKLAADHVDLMLMFTFQQGHFLGLEKALQGAGLGGKRKFVTLSDGSVFRGMSGEKAPMLWAQGEHEAVLSYLVEDVKQPIMLARSIEKTRQIRWQSSTGRNQQAYFDRLYTVRECFAFPQPDTSWMRNPPTRGQFVRWMPEGKLPQA